MWLLYQLLLAGALLVAAPFLLVARGRHYLPTLGGRLGGHRGPAVEGALWLHAVSVGEARVAAALARRLDPGLPLLVTTITPTGQAEARRLFADRAVIAYHPFDLDFAVGRFLRRFAPRALVLIEGDHWPLTLRRAAARGLPIAVANGRVGDRSFARLSRLGPLARALFAPVERFAVQSERDRERLRALDVPEARVAVTGNLKFDAPPAEPSPELAAAVETAAAGRPLLVAGSTMASEEALVLDAFAGSGDGEAALLVLAPRHPERWPEVASLLDRRGLAWVRRSALPSAGRPAVLLLDSLGELPGLYALARAAFIGGTLVPTGGHNPIEPAGHGIAIAVGPSLHNFAEIAERFDAALAWRRVADSEELGAAFADWLARPPEAAALGARARALVAGERGAVERTLEFLAPLLEGARGAA
ncbi:MAG: 3-deoxy-D-manno-octulosonic acid transferase [Thermoanaerobaculia bacterium]